MPEDPEISVIICQIFTKIVQLSKKEGKALMGEFYLSSLDSHYLWLFPYSSISVNNSWYTQSFESDDDSYIPNAFDLS